MHFWENYSPQTANRGIPAFNYWARFSTTKTRANPNQPSSAVIRQIVEKKVLNAGIWASRPWDTSLQFNLKVFGRVESTFLLKTSAAEPHNTETDLLLLWLLKVSSKNRAGVNANWRALVLKSTLSFIFTIVASKAMGICAAKKFSASFSCCMLERLRETKSPVWAREFVDVFVFRNFTCKNHWTSICEAVAG